MQLRETVPEVKEALGRRVGWVAGAKAEQGPAGTRHFRTHWGTEHQLVQGFKYLSSAW